MEINQAVIPAAGWGTRFLPFTKAVPKEMLPLGNYPAIHYIAQELADSGIQKCIMITTPYKQALENYFKECALLELFLKEKNKLPLIADVQKLIQVLNFSFINQDKALGLGHAVSLARAHITQDYFGVLLPDDIIIDKTPAIAQLMALAKKEKANILAVQEVPQETVSAYGITAIKNQLSPNLYEIESMVEKPALKDAPSNLAIIGRYVLSSKIFKALDEVKPSVGGEIQLTDGIARLIQKGHKVLAYKIQGIRYDIGTPSGWLAANTEISAIK